MQCIRRPLSFEKELGKKGGNDKAMTTIVEIVCCTVDDAVAAEAGGAGRIELCSALQVGGLTPSVGLLRAVKLAVQIPVMAMVRPRPSGFRYSDADLGVMLDDAALLRGYGADGLVFGSLLPNGSVNRAFTEKIVAIAAGKTTVFHRAFDITPDPIDALRTLIDCGVTRILTSGQKASAPDGIDLIRQLQLQADGRIEILPGGGIRKNNVAELLALSGCNQVHLAPRSERVDPTSSRNGIDYGKDGVVAADAVAAVVAQIRSKSPFS
jgi:copper homeostasis protein